MRQERGEESSMEGKRAAESRNEAGAEAPGRTGEPAEGVLTMVCLKCGKEYFFTDDTPPEGLRCEKCSNTVFRSFFSDAGDEASQDFRDSTERDLDSDDPEGDTLPGDLIDLNRGG